MRRKIFKNKSPAIVFVGVSLYLLLIYSMILCMYIANAEPSGAVEATLLSSYCTLILENVVCAFCITVVFGAFFIYKEQKNK